MLFMFPFSADSSKERICELKAWGKKKNSRRSRIAKAGGTGRDLTALEEECGLLRAMIDNLPDFIYVKDKKSVFLSANKSVARLMGAESPDDLIGKTDRDFYPKELAKKYSDDEKTIMRTGNAIINKEEKVVSKEGTVHLISTTKVPLRDRKNRVVGVVGIGSDVSESREAEIKRRESEKLFTYLAEYSPNMIFINAGGKIIYANRICAELMGYGREEFYEHDFDFMTLIAPESRDLVKTSFRRHSKGDEVLPYEYTLVTKEGRRIDAIISSKRINYEGKEAILGIITDITERKKAEHEIRRSEEQYRTIFENTGNASIIIEEDGTISLANGEFERLSGYDRDRIQGQLTCADFVKEEEREKLAEFHRQRMQKSPGVPKGYECSFVDREGNVKQVLMNMEPLPETMKCVASLLDITDRKQTELHLQRIATHDELTKLPNRRLFQQRLEHALVRAHRHNSLLGVLYLDLDDFKYVNDTYGHDMGDMLLRSLAGRVLECVRENDTVARIGGDEFTVILEDAYQLDDIITVTKRIIESVSKPFALANHESTVTISIGVSVYPEDGDTTQELLKKSDMAMYKAKRQGKNNLQFFSKKFE